MFDPSGERVMRARRFDRQIGCRSLKIHRVEKSVLLVESFLGFGASQSTVKRHAISNFMIASKQLQCTEIEVRHNALNTQTSH